MQEAEMSEAEFSPGELSEIRRKIDDIDEALSGLLADRLSLCRQVGAIKSQLKVPVQSHLREGAVLENVSRAAREPDISQAIASIYQAIMSESRRLQIDQAAKTRVSRSTGPHYFPRVLIIGLGLIGGALSRQIKKMLPETKITAVDRASILAAALAEGIIDEGQSEIVPALRRASLIILSASPEENLRLLSSIAPFLKRRQLVIDVTSTKEAICKLSEQLALDADFVGGHPFFGSEKTGYAGSHTVMVAGRSFSLTPTLRSSELSLRRLRRWLKKLQLKVILCPAAVHDKAVARTSHLIQLLCVAAGAEMADGVDAATLKGTLDLSGPGLDRLSRLMASPPTLWLEILEQNRVALLPVLAGFLTRLGSIARMIESGDRQGLSQQFDLASRIPACLNEIQERL